MQLYCAVCVRVGRVWVGRWVIGPARLSLSVFICVCYLIYSNYTALCFMTDRMYKPIVRLELDI